MTATFGPASSRLPESSKERSVANWRVIIILASNARPDRPQIVPTPSATIYPFAGHIKRLRIARRAS